MKPTLLFNNPVFNPCSAGVRATHYIPALLDSLDVPVACTGLNFYNPRIPVRPYALPDDIIVYHDSNPGNPCKANRICRYFFYYADKFYKSFDGARITKEECALVYHEDFLPSVQDICDHEVFQEDIITIPTIDDAWCFPESKTIENLLYVGKQVPEELPDFGQIPPPHEPQKEDAEYKDGFHAHTRTLSYLRRTRNFYSADHCTALTSEAALCGCNVFLVHSSTNFERQWDALEKAKRFVMRPKVDMLEAAFIPERIYKFFNV